jgi:SlyX protein
MEDRLIELETRLAFQEHTLQELNEVVTAQQRQLDRIEQQIAELAERLHALKASPLASEAEETPPPHY